MILHRDGADRRMGADPKPASVPDLARVLRQARTARGLELPAVSQQTGIPLDQLQDLESGTVDRLPDRVAILKALSRYAAFLHLPGDRFVMTLVEHWPGSPVPVTSGATTGVMNGPDTALGTIAPPAPASSPPAPASSPPLAVDDLSTRAVPVSVPVGPGPPTSIGLPIVAGRHNSTAQVPSVMADTGKTQAIRRGAPDGLLMVLVRSLAVVSAILIVVGTAWLVINRVHPQWLADLRLPYTSKGVTGATTATTTKSSSRPTAPKTTPQLRLVSATGNEATFSVTTSLFNVRVSAQGGDAWVQASGPLSTKPTYEGILKSGQSQVVPANHQLVVRIGSTAARIAVQIGHRVIGTYVPPGAPFTMTFTTK
ncbi:MAG: helix-turn-helix domain-containing protein [Acidimicrobiales bacterium]